MSDRFETPDVYWLGYTKLNESEFFRYLEDTQNTDFIKSYEAARDEGLSDAEIICSMFAKLCYKALSLGKNANVTRTRDIPSNLEACFDTGHGSIFEHINFNFIISPCSRVFTHELVRHRVGVAYSQTSGRYCRLDSIPIIWDPRLDPVREMWDEHLKKTEDLVYKSECELGLRVPCLDDPLKQWVPNDKMDFGEKKKITSAIRRIAPNGQSNEIAVTFNLRSLRHTMLMRTAAAAEWEIRFVFNKIFDVINEAHPLMFHGAKTAEVDGLREITGMKCQPYEKPAEMVLDEMSDEELKIYLQTRPTCAA